MFIRILSVVSTLCKLWMSVPGLPSVAPTFCKIWTEAKRFFLFLFFIFYFLGFLWFGLLFIGFVVQVASNTALEFIFYAFESRENSFESFRRHSQVLRMQLFFHTPTPKFSHVLQMYCSERLRLKIRKGVNELAWALLLILVTTCCTIWTHLKVSNIG